MEPELSKPAVYFDGSSFPCQAKIGYYCRKNITCGLYVVDVLEAGSVTMEGITQKQAMKRFHGHIKLEFGFRMFLPVRLFTSRLFERIQQVQAAGYGVERQ